ncbi:Glycine/sarcosine N-methyltransferase [Halomicronema hongdechloris C2206]|uniref:Glycine/sarcosine N-methyltransferase n=1 Tax=Halomicronema hongdechloris C2206 TaxID=1641165 RepID=A0A1Z3HQ43_9CYAN|nr:class I SAM-dependent methyltransferase [Halomicronema hongdechloris]ASC72440.1 Glycine/sarcosine N-methyltransferase [Halomicronema hongdechloris C2206]
MKTEYRDLNLRRQRQDYGSDPLSVRKTDHYQAEYIQSFVSKWDRLIGWDLREESEGDFFIDILRRHGVKKILDAATGTGFHSIRLLKAGFDVVSADGSPEMLAKAFENGRRQGLILRTVQADWRWLNRDIHEQFDAILCLGNSFTHLFAENDRRRTLAEFYAALNHDGILILDQRNYDVILDQGYRSKHAYYYCGQDVKVEPEYVDEGLARFRYQFPDQSVFHLNMYPLRKQYTCRLLREVGFQKIKTYGDFQETYRHEDQDFFIHIASKQYVDKSQEPVSMKAVETVDTAREYYNSQSADQFYASVWGGEDIHIGLYDHENDSVFEASQRTVEKMASLLDLTNRPTVLDIGAGYGGAGRYLAKHFNCPVTCLNLSEVQNQRNRQLNFDQGLQNLVKVVTGNFEDVPEGDNTFDVIWSQDAILHSGDRLRVLKEVSRVIKDNGEFIFTDPMQSDNCPPGVLQPVLDRIHLDSLGSPAFYRQAAASLGFDEVEFVDLSHQLVNHYSHILKTVQDTEPEARQRCGDDYIDRMKKGLQHWIEAGQNGYLTWGIFHFRKRR